MKNRLFSRVTHAQHLVYNPDRIMDNIQVYSESISTAHIFADNISRYGVHENTLDLMRSFSVERVSKAYKFIASNESLNNDNVINALENILSDGYEQLKKYIKEFIAWIVKKWNDLASRVKAFFTKKKKEEPFVKAAEDIVEDLEKTADENNINNNSVSTQNKALINFVTKVEKTSNTFTNQLKMIAKREGMTLEEYLSSRLVPGMVQEELSKYTVHYNKEYWDALISARNELINNKAYILADISSDIRDAISSMGSISDSPDAVDRLNAISQELVSSIKSRIANKGLTGTGEDEQIGLNLLDKFDDNTTTIKTFEEYLHIKDQWSKYINFTNDDSNILYTHPKELGNSFFAYLDFTSSLVKSKKITNFGGLSNRSEFHSTMSEVIKASNSCVVLNSQYVEYTIILGEELARIPVNTLQNTISKIINS